MANFDISGARFNEQLRMLETTDPVHADLMNAMFGQLIKNDVAMRDAVSVFAKTKNEQALFLLNLRRTGKRYGVHFDAYSVSPASTGTRLYDAVGKVATPSTDSVRGINDFEGESVFYGLEVNGYVDADGEFVAPKKFALNRGQHFLPLCRIVRQEFRPICQIRIVFSIDKSSAKAFAQLFYI